MKIPKKYITMLKSHSINSKWNNMGTWIKDDDVKNFYNVAEKLDLNLHGFTKSYEVNGSDYSYSAFKIKCRIGEILINTQCSATDSHRELVKLFAMFCLHLGDDVNISSYSSRSYKIRH